MFPGGEGAATLSTSALFGLHVYDHLEFNSQTFVVSAADFYSSAEMTHKLSRQKVALVRLFTDFNMDVILTDIDTVWLQDPTSYVSRCLESCFFENSISSMTLTSLQVPWR